MRRYNPQNNGNELNKILIEKYFIDSEVLPDWSDVIPGKNTWLKNFLPAFTHQDTIISDNICRLQGWFKPKDYEKYNILTPEMEVECFSAEYGLYVTIRIN